MEDDRPSGAEFEESPPAPPLQPVERTERLAAILDSYKVSLDEGRAPDKEEICRQHPELREELLACLTALEFVEAGKDDLPEVPKRLGDFRIVREIGRGAMGVVYEAEQVSLKRTVALKVLWFGNLGDAEALGRFEREAQTVARLEHPSIVPVLASGIERGIPYYAMGLVRGRDADGLVKEAAGRKEHLDLRTVARWGLDVAEALAYAHGRGVIHRDIKPSNLLVDGEGKAWLADFGLARNLGEPTVTSTGLLLGTPPYMSPEQAEAATHAVDHRTDIYSLGATLYRLATGDLVFDAPSTLQILDKVKTEDPVPPRARRPEIPRELEAIILKCLEKEPGRRFGTAGELAENLRRFLEGRPLTFRRYGRLAKARRWAQKNRDGISIALQCFAAAAVLFGLFSGAKWYAEKNQAFIALSSKDADLWAEVLDEDGGSVATVIPHLGRPIQVRGAPGTKAKILVRQCGKLDEMREIPIHAWGQRKSLEESKIGFEDLSLMDQGWWSPEPAQAASRAIDLGSGPCILVLREGKIACLTGRSREILWEAPLGPEFPRSAAPELPPSLTDLDGDGVKDPVWWSHHVDEVIAQSGKDGRILWKHGREAGERRAFQIVAPPSFAEIDGDGNPDTVITAVIANNCTEISTTADGEGTQWTTSMATPEVAAVSGRTGRRIWMYRAVLGDEFDREVWFYGWEEPWNDRETRWYSQVLRMKGLESPVVACSTGAGLLFLDLHDGHLLADRCIRKPLPRPAAFADIDGDGYLEAIILTEDSAFRVLEAVSLEDGKVLWKSSPISLKELLGDRAWFKEAPEFHLVDLDGDGRLEILVPAAREHKGDKSFWYWDRMRLLDAWTGKTLWEGGLDLIRTRDLPYFSFGPDSNGDGVQDIYSIADYNLTRQGSRQGYVLIQVISGSDGQTRKYLCGAMPRGWNLNLNEPDFFLTPWPGAPGESDCLVVTARYEIPLRPENDKVPSWEWHSNDFADSCVFSVRDGSFRTVPGMDRPYVSDLDGDGSPDLHFVLDEKIHTIGGKARADWDRHSMAKFRPKKIPIDFGKYDWSIPLRRICFCVAFSLVLWTLPVRLFRWSRRRGGFWRWAVTGPCLGIPLFLPLWSILSSRYPRPWNFFALRLPYSFMTSVFITYFLFVLLTLVGLGGIRFFMALPRAILRGSWKDFRNLLAAAILCLPLSLAFMSLDFGLGTWFEAQAFFDSAGPAAYVTLFLFGGCFAGAGLVLRDAWTRRLKPLWMKIRGSEEPHGSRN